MFYFPRSKRELWANSNILKHTSPYFEVLFSAGFKESQTTARLDKTTTGHDDEQLDATDVGQDSDDETDSIVVTTASIRDAATSLAKIKEVVVRSTAYITYRAVLHWIYSGKITFASLALPPGQLQSYPDGTPSAAAQLRCQAALEPLRVLPPSPKSVYQLADYLDIPDLTRLALDDLRSKLTVDNVLYQMTCPVAVHQPVRTVLVQYALDHWAEVRKNPTANLLRDPEALESLANPLAAAATLFELALEAEKLKA